MLSEKVNGVVLPRMSPERWQELKTFPLRRDDLFIVTYPKSGTTWMQQIVKLLRNGGKSDDVPLDRCIPWLDVLDCDFGKLHGCTPDMATSSDVLSPRAFKSHFQYEFAPGGLPHTSPAKYIYMMRNPKDVCVSYWHHVSMIEEDYPWEKHFGMFTSPECMWGTWFDHVLGWWKHNDASNILFVKYEDMLSDPLTHVRTVANFIGIENATDELIRVVTEKSSFRKMKDDSSCNYDWLMGKVFSGDSSFIRKGVVGNWKQQFSAEESKHLDDIFSEKMSGSGLTFQFE